MFSLSVVGQAQHQTLAGLTHEAATAIAPAPDVIDHHPSTATGSHSGALHESGLSRSAAKAYFVESNPVRAQLLAERALRHDPKDAEALLVAMEVAAMEDRRETMLEIAARLCAAGVSVPGDPRVVLAAARLRDAAANTPEFVAVIPRLQALLADSSEAWPDLEATLLRAAMDGARGLNPYALSRASGIVTDWRVVGPLPQHPLLDFDQQPVSASSDLSAAYYQNIAVENFQFADGWLRLPDYFSRNGVFYAAGRFSSLSAQKWNASVEARGLLELYVDGERVLRADTPRDEWRAQFEVTPGPHRLLVKFAGSSTPLRISLMPATEVYAGAQHPKHSTTELAYLLAAGHYANRQFRAAVNQIDEVPSSENSSALVFLKAEAMTRLAPASTETTKAWSRLRVLTPSAVGADEALAQLAFANGEVVRAAELAAEVLALRPSDATALEIMTSAQPLPRAGNISPIAIADRDELWQARIRAHPSCSTLQAAVEYFRSRGKTAAADDTEKKLADCAPESLAYAKSVSVDGKHDEAARSLQQLLAAAPLNRAARLMLVRELQLAGDDIAAQRAAAEWVHVAPNAGRYHRLAAAVILDDVVPTRPVDSATQPFYQPYRRDVAAMVRQETLSGNDAVVLLEDHVAISRPDGSVALYVHTARTTAGESLPAIPPGAQIVAQRVIHPEGAVANVGSPSPLQAGDIVDQEYVIHYVGDGGIPEHCEAFQFVFGNFNERVLQARFVVLTPAEQSDRGAVITTGDAPEMSAAIEGSWLVRQWNMKPLHATNKGTAVVRVVEQENGWSVPSSAEHQRRIETIHPKPLPQES